MDMPAPTRFAVLGPLVVERVGSANVGGRQRALLDALLVDLGQIVSVPRLTRWIWPEAAPTNPRNAVQVLVGRLRQQLGLGIRMAETPALITDGAGYRLVLDENCCDLLRFERLVRDACRTADQAVRAALVAEAMGLWRGRPFDGMLSPAGDAAVTAARQRVQRLYTDMERLDVAATTIPFQGRAVPLRGKLRIPQVRPDAALRPRVTAALAGCAELGQAVLVRAPAGFGKSTALAQWAATRPAGSVGWVSLDDGDNDPSRLWLHVAHALGVGDVPGTQPGSRQFLDAMLDGLEAGCGTRWLVLDDYHRVTNPDIHADLAQVLDLLPATVGMVIASRGEPGLPLARLRASRRLREVGIDLLRFTAPEALELLDRGFGVDATDSRVARSADRADGWAVGLCLLGLALRDRAPGEVSEPAFDCQSEFLGYLDTEVLDRLPPRILSFLLATCVLDRLAAPLCDAVAAIDDGAALLDQLRRLNLFVIDVNRDAGWFRYHHVFASALRARLERDNSALIPVLHRRASSWYAAHGHPDDAISHAFAGGDNASAVRLVSGEFANRYRAGHVVTLAAWLRALPDEAAVVDPGLALGAVLLFHEVGDLRERERWQRNEAAHGADVMPIEDREKWHLLNRTVRRLETGDVHGAVRDGQAALALGAPGGFADTAWWLTACRSMLARALFFSRRLPEARKQLVDAGRNRSEHFTHRVTLPALRGLIAGMLGEHEEAAALSGEAQELLDRLQTSGVFRLTTEARLLTAVLSLERNDPANARHILARIVESPAWPHPDLPVQALVVGLLCRAEHALGNDGPARRWLAELAATLQACHGAELLTSLHAELEKLLGPALTAGDPLTERERSVLRLLRGTLTLPEIANELWVSPNTVKTHVRAIYRKLEVTSRSELRDR
ncbi:LuxR C-terminal-related transcriptional regulator [Winogradskya consettensis]|uniref:Helix-turn-helix transcriptional regulator n=2 Tax=Winogradskya consettensis TaxID=113560 RepID=A0A919VUS8_9ACTN|nr:helix-turn-helix transcriptional regulator [Actinoplanes consettensis]